MLPHKNSHVFIELDTVICLEASAMYTKFYYVKEGLFVSSLFSGSLKNYIEYLDGDQRFFRTHRSWLIHKKSIVSYKKDKSLIVLENNLEVPLSRNNKKEFQLWFNN